LHRRPQLKQLRLIQTFFGAMQMIGGPIYGYLIRQLGIQKALVICYSCTATSSLLIFTDKVSLYVSILPSIFMHGQQGHQTLLSAFTMPGKERTNAFGRMGITFGEHILQLNYYISQTIRLIETTVVLFLQFITHIYG
uniref:MFS domain-containing protein n=1 Tax=Toxocara canis TaxID=6265 RepID=A0A183U8N8_TOXCA